MDATFPPRSQPNFHELPVDNDYERSDDDVADDYEDYQEQNTYHKNHQYHSAISK